MRKLLPFIIGLILITGGLISRAQVSQSAQNAAADTAEQDSSVDIIGWFSKNDTVDYWINTSRWKFKDGDTIKTAGVAEKVRIVVTDSTSKGYNMEYTFLECVGDSASGSPLSKFQNKIVEKLGQKIVGTTIKFETDEYGKIVKFNNLSQIKKQAKSLFKECMKEFVELEEIKGLKDMGFDMKKLIDRNVDTDDLVDGYVEELNLLLMFHGQSYYIGEKTSHEDATDEELEQNTTFSVSLDPEDYSYNISFNIEKIIPREVVRNTVGGLLGMFAEEVATDSIQNEINTVLNVDGTNDTYYSIDYMPCGWPYKALRQVTSMIGKHGKAEQTYISLDGYSLGNWRRK